MAVAYFSPTLALDANNTPQRTAEAQVYAAEDTSFSSPLAVTDLNGIPFADNKLRAENFLFPAFLPPTGVSQVVVRSGEMLTPLTSVSVERQAAVDAAALAAERAAEAGTAAGAAAAAREGAEAAAEAAEAVGTTNDTVIAGRINDTSSATRTALNTTTAALIDARTERVTAGAWTPGTATRPLAADKTRILVYGSSTDRNMADALQAIISGELEWPVTVVNRAVSSERFEHAAARQGLIPVLITFPGNTIPASGSVAVTTSLDSVGSFGVGGFTGYVDGIRGTFARSGSAYNYVWTRTAAGTAKTVAGPVEFTVDPVDPAGMAFYRDTVLIHGGGKNNSPDTIDPVPRIEGWDVASIEWLVPKVKTYLVNGMFTSTGSASLRRDRVNRTNAMRAARFGSAFMDLSAYLSSSQVWEDTGVTPDSTSLAQQAIGELPHQLTTDGEHMDELTTYWAVWRAWIPKVAAALGLIEPTPPAPPDTTSDLVVDFTFEYLEGTVANGSDVTSLVSQGGASSPLTLATLGGSLGYPSLEHGSPAALVFDGAETIRTTGSTVLIPANEPLTVVTVARVTSAAAWSRLIGPGSTTDGYRAVLFGPDGTKLGGDTVATGALDVGVDWPNGAWFVHFQTWNADLVTQARINKNPAAVGIAASLPNWRGLGFMATSGGASTTTGKLRRVMMFQRAFTKVDMDALYDELVAGGYLS